MLTGPLIDLFLLTRAQSRAAATVKFYSGRLKLFRLKYAAREFAEITLAEITLHLAEAGQGRSDSTRRHNAVALEALQKFALAQRIIPAPLFDRIEKPPVGQRDRLPTEAETAALLAKASPAFLMIYTALRQCGARPNELCRATCEHYDAAKGVIVLKQHKTARKTGKPRRIPVGKKLRELLAQSLETRTTGPLFLSPAGKPWTPENLSRTYTRLRKAAGLTAGLVLYLARHECGSALCKSKGIEAARRILGHSSSATTQRYVHYDDTELQDLQDAVNIDPPPAADKSIEPQRHGEHREHELAGEPPETPDDFDGPAI